MPRKTSRLNVYILGIAIIVAAVLGYYLPTKRPEAGVTLTPKEYIELVEKKKEQRRRFAEEEEQAATPATEPPADPPPADPQAGPVR
jgi:hypothetical protein